MKHNGKKPKPRVKRKARKRHVNSLKNLLENDIDVHTGKWMGEPCNYVHVVAQYFQPTRIVQYLREYKPEDLVPCVQVMFPDNTYFLLDNSKNFGTAALFSGRDKGCLKYGYLIHGIPLAAFCTADGPKDYISMYASEDQRNRHPDLFEDDDKFNDLTDKEKMERADIQAKIYSLIEKDEEE